MEGKFASLVFVVVSGLFVPVEPYYCEFGQCGNDEYCCGKNLCCTYVYRMWYPWIGVMFVLLLLLACAGLFRYCFTQTSLIIIPSSMTRQVSLPLGDDSGDREALQPLTKCDELEASSGYYEVNLNFYPAHVTPPPSYNQTMVSDATQRMSENRKTGSMI
ncbi:unnamed protein product [Notodromas monacha]|uniref:Vesicular, overexpressed in cancer, prosurvival protein 1 n=1 Tax=Notodromas monacha TaxID=399045 RepID=A0A7R9BPS7_9CRUS|nr:unnamed protein product [Notodromas monacha]CAG0918080.1 unnamed protein product [Notodromas monacha]